jgi:UDP-N-acetylmuramoyl-tripeptide--D-alanyl-D-alanine ligase
MWINLFFLILLIFVLVRSLLWLTRLQQKEYRWDRLWHYLKTEDGRKDLLKIFPSSKDFLRTGLVRPKITARMLVVVLLYVALLSWLVFTFFELEGWFVLFVYLTILFFIPLIILIVSIPTAVIFEWQVWLKMKKAQKQIITHKPKIIGITGSYGKTSTKIILKHVLSQKYSVYATQRSFNTRYSLARDIVYRYQGQEIVIIEYAAYKPGEIKWLAQRIQPHWAVITGLVEQHLAIFGSVKNIIKAKAELIESLKPDGLVFVNAKDPRSNMIVEYARQKIFLSDKQIIPYGGVQSQIELSQQQLTNDGHLSFVLNDTKVVTKLVGYRYSTIIQAGIAVARELGLTWQQIIEGLQTFEPPLFFVQLFQHNQKFWLLDDGRTTNPMAFFDVIDLAQEIIDKKKIKGRKILITSGIIDLGEETNKIHLKLAKKAKAIFTDVVYTGNPGKRQFVKIFGHKVISEKNDIEQLLLSLGSQDFVAVEGWVPLWLQHQLITQQ